MKYLYFDIECANCLDGVGKICEFAYVQTDDKFNVLAEESIEINPRAPFDVKGFAMKGIELEHPYSYYAMQPDFKAFYEKIRGILQQPNQCVVGHGTSSDAHFLIGECARYKMRPINFSFADTAKLAKLIYRREKGLNLRQLYADLCNVKEAKQKHIALDDAYMTMALAKYYAEDLKMTFHQVLSNYSLAFGEAYLGRVVESDASPFGYKDSMHLATANKKIVDAYINDELSYNSETTYVLPTEFEKENFKGLMVILQRLKEKGWLFSFAISKDVVYVANGESDYKLAHYRKYLEKKGHEEHIAKITFGEFLQRLELLESDLCISDERLDEIIGASKRHKAWFSSYKKTHTILPKIDKVLKENEFECSVDFPVIQYKAKVLLEQNGEMKEIESFVFYDYVFDNFFNLHPYRVNRAVNSYLPEKLYKKAIQRSRDAATMEITRKIKISAGQKIKKIEIYREYPYITSYKFKGIFEGDSIKFEFPKQIFADEDFKGAIQSLDGFEIDIQSAVKELYDEKLFAAAVCVMAKMRFQYKDKTFVEPKIVNKKYQVGDEILLPKEYYLRHQQGGLDDSYLPSKISFSNELFKGKIELPVLIRRK